MANNLTNMSTKTGKSIGEVWDTHWTRVGELRHSGVGEGTRQRLSDEVLR
jgi:hypothetical protein